MSLLKKITNINKSNIVILKSTVFCFLSIFLTYFTLMLPFMFSKDRGTIKEHVLFVILSFFLYLLISFFLYKNISKVSNSIFYKLSGGKLKFFDNYLTIALLISTFVLFISSIPFIIQVKNILDMSLSSELIKQSEEFTKLNMNYLPFIILLSSILLSWVLYYFLKKSEQQKKSISFSIAFFSGVIYLLWIVMSPFFLFILYALIILFNKGLFG